VIARSPDTVASPVQAPGLARACSGRRTITVRPAARGARIRRVAGRQVRLRRYRSCAPAKG
jgi:hypothetical protein